LSESCFVTGCVCLFLTHTHTHNHSFTHIHTNVHTHTHTITLIFSHTNKLITSLCKGYGLMLSTNNMIVPLCIISCTTVHHCATTDARLATFPHGGPPKQGTFLVRTT